MRFLALAALALTACGGGESDEDKITETIETAATTTDPSNCTELETQRFIEQNTQRKGQGRGSKPAKKKRKRAKKRRKRESLQRLRQRRTRRPPRLNSKAARSARSRSKSPWSKKDGNWKLDQIEGFANYDGKALGEAFEKQFEEEPGELSPEQAKCISGKIAGLSQAEAEEVFFGGSAEPIIELAQSCA